MHTKPKKSLGQNFLIDPNIRRKIITACALAGDDCVLEIGAGRGELSRLIAPHVEKLFVVELDQRYCLALDELFSGKSNVTVINQDILTVSLGKYARRVQKKIKVIGNIPYYISSPILAYLVRNRCLIHQAFLTVQKEFAVRLCAQAASRDYGPLSCFVQYHMHARRLFPIKKTCFLPAPRVDSEFMCLTMREQPAVEVSDEDRFFAVIRRAFGQRRKMLKNSLKGIVSQEKIADFFHTRNICATARAEELTLDDFARLASR